MPHDEIAAFADEEGLSGPATERLQKLVEALVSRGNFESLDTLVESFEPVSLRLFADDEEPEKTEARPRLGGLQRYEDLGAIGAGGTAEVRRVRDTLLNRVVAMKTARGSVLKRPKLTARFVEEAQATSQLQHPNIVPVYDAGVLSEGEVWFTMKEVRGLSMSTVIEQVHERKGHWTFRRLISAFHQVCNAVAFAHDRGVIHRDLKPENVMLGERGEVYVVDWGLAKVLGRADLLADSERLDAVVTDQSGRDATMVGTVNGTPVYMSPEQARGENDLIDERSDIYGLGAVLYEILSARPPGSGKNPMHVIIRVGSGKIDPLTPKGVAIPEELALICDKALDLAPEQRFQSAASMAEEVEDWLDGARRREHATELVERALALIPEAASRRRRGLDMRRHGAALLAKIPNWHPEEDKSTAWDAEDMGAALLGEANLKQIEVDQGLHAALRIAPDLPAAHAALAQRYLARHREAEALRHDEARARADKLVRLHADSLPKSHDTRKRAELYLRGRGAISLQTEPNGAEVLLHRYVQKNRRLVPVFERSLGKTPLEWEPLDMGSYLCVIRHPECADVRYPVHVNRLGHWDTVPPGGDAAQPVWLPPREALDPDELYIPAGWFLAGGDAQSASDPPRPIWCGGMVAQRFPVTNAEYIAFLDDLVARDREDEALARAPRERAGTVGAPGALIYGRDDDGRFLLRPDADGDVWLPEWPVFHVDWHGARAYMAWKAERTGHPWRLPHQPEWEKAARGVDGRWYPWGDHYDGSWSCGTDYHRAVRLPLIVDSCPVDESPYGVRGMGGNISDWCLDSTTGGVPQLPDQKVEPHEPEDGSTAGVMRVICGGAWSLGQAYARVASRTNRFDQDVRLSIVGFRGVYSLR